MIKKIIAAGVTLAALALAPAALASQPTQAHLRSYKTEYAAVRHQFGARAAGCNLVGSRGSCHVRATDEMLMSSLAVLDRLLDPSPPVAVSLGVQTAAAMPSEGSAQAVATVITASAAPSGLEACIIQHESGGNPDATNGQYGGIAQWSPTAWAEDGGTRYASSPTGASYAEQQVVLEGEGSSGMSDQQGQYDGCG